MNGDEDGVGGELSRRVFLDCSGGKPFLADRSVSTWYLFGNLSETWFHPHYVPITIHLLRDGNLVLASTGVYIDYYP
jgi:hypothetical protein